MEKLIELRAKIEATKQEMERLRHDSLPHDETRERVMRAIHDQLDYLPIGQSIIDFQSPDPRLGRLPGNPTMTASDLAWLMGPEALADRIMERIKEYGRAVGLPMAERLKVIEKLRVELRALEISEEREVCALEDAGIAVYRREDVDVGLLFEVWSAPGFKPPAPAARMLGNTAA